MPTDTIAPRVQSFTASDPTTTNASVVHYTLTFSEPVTGVGPGNFSLVTSGVSGASVASVTAVGGSNGAQYVIAVNTGTGDGTIALDLASGDIQDLAGNRLAGNTFDGQVTYVTANSPQVVAIGDLNGDGKPDLAVATETDPFPTASVSILLGNGNGTFQAQTTYATAGTDFPSVAIGDINGDGIPDIASVANGSSNVSVLLGNGDGTFQPRITYATQSLPHGVAIGDLNGDGRPDLAVANLASDSVSVLLGNSSGTLQAQTTYATGGHPYFIVIGDLNGDGRPDLVTANSDTNTVSVLLGSGNGTFQPQTEYTAGNNVFSVALGDLNGDGTLDIVTANENSNANTVSVLLGNGDGTFQPQTAYAAGSSPQSVVIGDVNGDGRPDLAIANIKDEVFILLGNGDGTFQPQGTYATGLGAAFIAIGDLNADGRPDLAVANRAAMPGTVSILLNDTLALKGPTYTIDKPAPADHAPIASNGSASGEENAVVTGALVATDADGDPLTFSRVAQASHGSVSVNANGSFAYTPNAGFSGTDSFTFKANDGVLDSNIATVSLTIFDVATPPHLASGPASSASPAATGSFAGLTGDPFHDAAGAAPLDHESTIPATLAHFVMPDFHLL